MGFRKRARALLVLGRVSNLPTVWSNCLAAWLLGGSSHVERLPFVIPGATLVYLGGMLLNDAFDVQFDTHHRPERPVPSGAIALREVWNWGIALLLIGLGMIFVAGVVVGVLGIGLVLAVVLYDAIHKKVAYAPVIMGACRFALYLVAGATATGTVSAAVTCGGAAMLCYIVGLSYIARRESTGGPTGWWPMLPLLAPVVLAFARNYPERPLEPVLLAGAVVALWAAKCVRYTLNFPDRNIGRAVSGLLAGICLVDWLAVSTAPRFFSMIFVALFLLALLFQKWVPAS